MGVPDVLLDVVDGRVARATKPAARFAEVTGTSPLLVEFPGDTESVRVSRLSSYSPSIGQTAILLRVGTRFVAIGALV